MEKLKSVFSVKKITVPRIAILGIFLALLIALKWALGPIPGLELISFAFIFLGIFLPIFDLALLIASFNILVLVVYGFGSWWLMYWIIWPMDAFISKSISKFTKNKYIFALWGFIAGASVFFWYFLSDLLFFGNGYAILNIISAIPINAIEGLTTMISCLIIAPMLANVFNDFKGRFWPSSKTWEFAKNKHPKLNIVMVTILVIAAILGIILLFVYNDVFLDLKNALIPRNHNKIPGGGYDPVKK